MGFRIVPFQFAQWKRQCCACTHRSRTMIDSSSKFSHQRPDNFHALPRPDVFRSGAVIHDDAFHGCFAVDEFDLNPSAAVPECMPRSIGDQFGYDHAEPPAARRTQLKRAFDEYQLNAPVLQLCTADRPAKLAQIRRGIHPAVFDRHLQRPVYTSGVGYLLDHAGQRYLDIVIADRAADRLAKPIVAANSLLMRCINSRSNRCSPDTGSLHAPISIERCAPLRCGASPNTDGMPLVLILAYCGDTIFIRARDDSGSESVL
jgi:hypothetical protein